VTIAISVILGALSGLVSRKAMPVANDGGNTLAAAVGVGGAIVGGALAASLTNSGIIGLNPLTIGWAMSGALCTLFAYRCLAMRKN
jgi:uncharacterized membrane protein YeaQ/YmgE (transglycosylase-associated protein family)